MFIADDFSRSDTEDFAEEVTFRGKQQRGISYPNFETPNWSIRKQPPRLAIENFVSVTELFQQGGTTARDGEGKIAA